MANDAGTPVYLNDSLRADYAIIRAPQRDVRQELEMPVATTLHYMSKPKGESLLFAFTPQSKPRTDGKFTEILTHYLR